MQPRRFIHSAALLCALSGLAGTAFAQGADSASYPTVVRGSVSVTNKGISTVPNLSLGKPAAIFDLSVSRKALSFEPQFRFGLDGKPWSFLFWWRYRLQQGDRLRLTVGAHPAISFRAAPVAGSGSTDEVIYARRYLAGELSPSYAVTPNLSLGSYYLYSYGVEKEVTRHTHLVSLRVASTTALGDGYSLRVNPQVYYLRLDRAEGLYANSSFTLARKDLPVSVSTTVTQALRSIHVGEDFLWNVSLNYVIQ
jgi:hypothetical protein